MSSPHYIEILSSRLVEAQKKLTDIKTEIAILESMIRKELQRQNGINRNLEIYTAHLIGKTLQELSTIYGVTPGRIKEICRMVALKIKSQNE